MISVHEIADRLNGQAAALAPELLPNGHRSGNKWMASGIADTGRSASLYVHLSGSKVGHWADMGNAAPGEAKGDMLDLLRLCMGLRDAREAVNEAKRRLGIQDDFMPGAAARPDPAEQARRAEDMRQRTLLRQAQDDREKEAKARRAQAAWLAGVPIAGTGAEFYLRGRQLTPGPLDMAGGEWPNVLRFHPEMWCKPEGCKVPAMLAAIYRADGQQIGTHRTFLQNSPQRGWTKIDSPNAKMVLGNMWGGFIPISRGSSGKSMRAMPEGEPVYVTEGIEDAICVRMMKPDARVIAAISLPNIGGVILPKAARRLVIVADRDDKPDALAALERSIAQQQARGLRVELVMPPPGFKDMNDWLRGVAASAPAQRKGVA